MVVCGLNEPRNLRVVATTVRDGDPSFTGALAGIALGLPTWHILELEGEVPAEVWREEMAMKELEIEEDTAAAIFATLSELRGEARAS